MPSPSDLGLSPDGSDPAFDAAISELAKGQPGAIEDATAAMNNYVKATLEALAASMPPDSRPGPQHVTENPTVAKALQSALRRIALAHTELELAGKDIIGWMTSPKLEVQLDCFFCDHSVSIPRHLDYYNLAKQAEVEHMMVCPNHPLRQRLTLLKEAAGIIGLAEARPEYQFPADLRLLMKGFLDAYNSLPGETGPDGEPGSGGPVGETGGRAED